MNLDTESDWRHSANEPSGFDGVATERDQPQHARGEIGCQKAIGRPAAQYLLMNVVSRVGLGPTTRR